MRRVPAATLSSPMILKMPTWRRVRQMRAAAKLLAEIAHRDHADHVGIFFAEEHHGPGLAGFGQRHVRVADRLAGQNLVVHLVFDPNHAPRC